MKILNKKSFLVFIILLICNANPALSFSKNDKNHRNKKWHSNQNQKSFGFESEVKEIISKYYGVNINNNTRKNCPPGLAKKNSLCMPPGQYKKIEIGKPLPLGLEYKNLPPQLLSQLPPLPTNLRYGMVDNNMVLLSNETRLVLDVISLISNNH